MPLLKLYLLIIFSVLLSSCNKSSDLPHLIQDYQSRLANVLNLDSPKLRQVSLAPYPQLADLTLNITDTRIKLFEFYQLKHCELYSLVAERNTSLGRLQLPSTRYVYEQKLLNALDKCIEISQDAELRTKLKLWQQQKQHNIQLVWADLLQRSSETKYAFSSNQHHITGNEQTSVTSSIAAFEYLRQINQKADIQSSQLEAHLHNIQKGALPAKLWLSQATLTKQLNQSTKWLKLHNSKLKCKNGSAETKVKYLANVFQLYFIERIQPIASKINHYHYQLTPVIQTLSHQPSLSEELQNYLEQMNEAKFIDYQTAIKQHIKFWQDLFKRCNIQPGSLAS